MSVLRPTPRKLKSEQQRKKIMDAAVVLFQQHGFQAVGVRDIAETAGVSTGTFYHYFGGKQDVFNAIHTQVRPDFDAVLSAAALKPSPAEALKDFLADYMVKQVLSDGLEFTCHRMFVIRKHSPKTGAMYQGCLRLVQLARQKGELTAAAEPEQILDHLLAVHRGVIYEWCVAEGGFDLSQRMAFSIGYSLRAFQAE